MRERAENGPCRINPETEKTLIVGEPGFLTAQEEKLVVETIRGRHAAYAFSDDERGRLDVDIIPMIMIHTVPHEPWNLRGARYSNPVDEEKVVNYLDGKIRTHVADYSSGPYASPWFCFVKPNGTLRWVQDLQRLNAVTVRDAGGLPNADALSEACAGRIIISLIDLYSGYDQFPVYPSDRSVTVMHTPRGLIHMNFALQGWTNAVAMVQRHMVRAMQPISPHVTQPYIDDQAVKGPKEKDEQKVMPGIRRFVWDHVQDLCKVLDLLKEHNLTASGPKSRHCMSGATILGFVCDERGRRPDTKKTNKILEWPTPFQTITEVRSFMGTCGFWRIFIKGFAAKTEQLRKLVRQGQDWEWGDRQESVIKDLKKEFEEGGQVLGVPDHAAMMTRPFIVETDAGPHALGGVLIQRDPNGEERPLRFESRTLNTSERNYSQFKRKTLAVLHCLRIFRNYFFGNRFVLRVDATTLAGSLKHFAPSDPTIARWLTYIWMFDFELERIPGTKNRADGLSRVDWDKNRQGVIEDTPQVDGFLDSEEDVRLHINSWALAVGRMMELTLAGKYELQEDPLTIENGALQVGKHEKMIGGVYLLANALLQEEMVRNTVLDQEEEIEPGGGDNVIHEREDDGFEEGEIKEAFREEEYEGVYLELGMLLSCEMRERDACARILKMRPSSWHAMFPIESFLKTWRRQDLETDLTFEELLDLRARQIGAIEDRIEEAASRTADSRTKDNFRWDKMARVRKELLKVGDVVLLYDSSLEKQWSRKLEWLGPYRVTKCGEHGAYQIEELNGTAWKDWVSGSRLKKFVARDQMRTRREDRPPVFQGGNIELFLMEFERHAREFGWDNTRMLGEVRGTGEWADPIAKLVRESLSWQDFGWRMEGLHPSSLGRDGQPIRFDSTNLGEFLWAYDRYVDELCIPGEQRVGSFLLFVRHHIRPFVRSMVASAINCGHCKKLLWNYYTPARQASERRGVEKRRREPETEARGTFEQGASPGAQREEKRKEHKSHQHERAEGSDGSNAPPQPAQREMDGPMPDAEPDIPHEPHTQEQREVQSAEEKELDRKERAAREQEIRTRLRMKNLAELHERMQQGKGSEEVKDKKGKGTCTQEEDPPLFSEVWMGFDKLMDATERSGGQHQEMGVNLVSTDLLNLKGVIRERFAAARASDQKIGHRLTKVAQKAYSQRVDWKRVAEDLKKELERQGKELEAVKADMEKVSAEN
ncbi:hypothetical protein CBR_g50150 [Chara braunii]|uniref:Uncharacterized protein n=1 Tax=Chara braunii TaxID=69332 RepID=A0A388M639_CHABU|nr:hypothetical protein CBR_g50150 [Chara braunii]|eukprot:GBG90057.1 hypothetical protein CBR_g50150 [Chara braunii]